MSGGPARSGSARASAGVEAAAAWQIWIDTGGTFTDCVAWDPGGALRRVKVLSDGSVRGRVEERLAGGALRIRVPWPLPDDFFRDWTFRLLGREGRRRVAGYRGREGVLSLEGGPAQARAGDDFELLSGEEAPVLAARIATGTGPGSAFPPLAARLATTRGTNALLERNGAPTALFITRGFANLLEIGNQQRPELFALQVVKPEPLYAATVEVDERLAADGSELRPLSTEVLEGTVYELLAGGVVAAAVALLHAYRNPAHEEELADFLAARGFRHVSISSRLAGRIRIVPRATTAVVDAYLAPVIGDYLERVKGELGGASLLVMTSAGGLVEADRYRPKDSLLSGPAGGVVGAAAAGAASGLERVIVFDMGGTSTDVARFDREYDYRYETRVGEARLLAPALAIETVAAGGGSICRFDGERLRVGPRSAGARPGPACYGAGGPLTLTDVNLLLGRLDPGRFELPIDRRAAAAAAGRELDALRSGEPTATLEAMLAGFLRIADERMAGAVRRISIREGYRPSDYALVAFGGAGAQHACSLARLLEIDTVLVPADAGLLSAHGLGRARIERFAERQVLAPLESVRAELPGWVEELEREARRAVAREGVPETEVEARLRRVSLRLEGQDFVLELPWSGVEQLAAAFADAYLDHYGYRPEPRPLELESLRVVASSREPERDAGMVARGGGIEAREARPESEAEVFLAVGWRGVPVFERRELAPGDRFEGPALVFERHSATVVATGWRCRMDDAGGLLLERGEDA